MLWQDQFTLYNVKLLLVNTICSYYISYILIINLIYYLKLLVYLRSDV